MNIDTLSGSCHCGDVTVALQTGRRPSDLQPRACDCSFCAKHGAAWVSDPEGRLIIGAASPDALLEYRQGSGTARLLSCRSCGVLVAVVFDVPADATGVGGRYGAVNARALDGDALPAPRTVSPQSLDAEQKQARWLEIWCPEVELVVAGVARA